MWLPVAAALIIPGAGHVLLGKSTRGLLMLCWMVIFGYLTFHLSSPHVSFLGRISGGVAIWVLSVLEVYRLSHPRA